MRSRFSIFRPALILSFGVLTTGCGGGGTSSAPATGIPVSSPSKFKTIQHIVVIFQENRTPDNLFRGLPNADIAASGINSSGETIPLTPVALANDYDLDHSHRAFVDMYDGGKIDGADKITLYCNKPACPGPNLPFKYVNPSDIQPYFQLAEEYTFADRMFQTNQGPSFPAHQSLLQALRPRRRPVICSPQRIPTNTPTIRGARLRRAIP